MDVKISFRSDVLPEKHISFDLDQRDLRCQILDNIVQQKTQEFLDIINRTDPSDLDIPPAYQVPVLRGRIQK